MKCFVDSSVLIEHIKGTRTSLLDKLFEKGYDCYINPIVFSEYIFHFLGVTSGKSPLAVKETKQIRRILKEFDPYQLISVFSMLTITETQVINSAYYMSKYNLLPNDALILSACSEAGIKALATYDKDFLVCCKSEGLTILSEENI
jgi:predicted nucleic acid-binding protein